METKTELWQETLSEESRLGNNIFHVAPGVWRMKDMFVNVFIIKSLKTDDWVLVDTGLATSYPKIKHFISEVISEGSIPSAIILTHGHFDHRGSLPALLKEWQVPVYAHRLEAPYLTGKSAYPPADPTVGGGAMATAAFLYPNKPIDISQHLEELPEDESVPFLKGWHWIHTPGHTPGHISLFRKKDRVLVAGDAFVTTKQESLYHVMTQKVQVSGPPKYFTPNWVDAARSVKELAALEPEIIVSGHGRAVYGIEAKKELNKLTHHFWQLAIPSSGRYVNDPARFNENGVSYLPPAPANKLLLGIASFAACATVGYLVYKQTKKSGRPSWASALMKLAVR